MKLVLKSLGLGCLGLIGIVIILGVIGNKTPTNNVKNPDSKETSGTQQEEPKMAGLNEEVQSGALTFTVTDVETTKLIGQSSNTQKAQGTFYIVTIKINNTGNITQTFDPITAKIRDTQGREFDRSIEGSSLLSVIGQGKTFVFSQQIQPTLSVTGNIVFDLPDDSVDPYIALTSGFLIPEAKIRLTTTN